MIHPGKPEARGAYLIASDSRGGARFGDGVVEV
jgi:hypothetical protein